MSGLEQAFYIVGLIYMGISLCIIFGILAALLIIRKKVISLETMIKDKVDTFTSIPTKVAEAIDSFQNLRKHKS